MRMRMKAIWNRFFVVVFVGVLVGAGLTACARTPPEQALRERVDLLQRDIDARRADAIAEALAEDFVGNGGMDRRQARRMAAALFLRYRDVGVRFGPLQVRMHGDVRATVRFTAAASGGSGGLLPQDAQVYEVTTGWRSDDDEWLMTSAEWEPKL